MRKIIVMTFAWLLPSILAGLIPTLAGVQDKGMIELFELDELTVIYPASPAKQAAENRLSAERKAAFLTRFRAVPTVCCPTPRSRGPIWVEIFFSWGGTTGC